MKRLHVAFAAEILIILLVTMAVFTAHFIPEFLPRVWHRLLHIFGAIVFFGNIIVGAFWLAFAEASQKEETFLFTVKTINYADLILTGPGLILLLVNGSVLAAVYQNPTAVDWLFWSLIWFSLSGILWVGALLPMQFRLAQMAEKREFPWDASELGRRSARFLRLYYAFGTLTLLFVFLSFMRMVLK